MSNGNREFKSDVFSMLMEIKKYAMSVYNCLNDTNFTNLDDLEVHTLDKGVSLTVRNDAAFVVDASLSIYEHQSTVCPNMPVRNLIYYTTIVSKLLKKKNIYGKKLIKIPIPKFVVFYNGDEEQPEEYDMKLSDAFEKETDNPELELVCKVYNINFGKNKDLLDRCPVLKEYMIFVGYVRLYLKEYGYEDLEKAINQAIDRCIQEDILADFLKENRAEVVKVTQLDYTFDRQITMEREEAREEGRAEGREEGRAEGREEGRAEGREEGRAEGREEGRAEGEALGTQQEREKIAIKMIKVNKPLEEIMEFTELPIEKINELTQKIKR
ncbi:MAG: hypothetical protein U0K86_03890 [Agathobacter sp.]|nr:hypothetical protein [Agathobacter sp.]